MSWGRSYTGTKSAVTEKVASLATETADADAKAGASQTVIDQHAAQTQFAADAVTKLLETVGDKDDFRVTVQGHGSAVGDGFVSLTVNYDALKVVDTGVLDEEQGGTAPTPATDTPIAGA